MDEEMLRIAHKKYLELESLNKTCKWLKENYGIGITRHQLSPLFHNNGLKVYPPNGKPVRHYRSPEFKDATNELAADWVKLLWSDVLGYLNGSEPKIYFMSACAAFNGVLYRTFLDRLNSNVARPWVSDDMLPPGVSMEDIIRGDELYRRGYEYWVEPIGDINGSKDSRSGSVST